MPKTRIRAKDVDDDDVDLFVEVGQGYEPYRKKGSLPARTPFEDGFITWFNAFGVKVAGPNGADADVPYTVTCKKRSQRLFYLDTGVQPPVPVEITKQRHGLTDPDSARNVTFQLSLGDPPVGQYP